MSNVKGVITVLLAIVLLLLAVLPVAFFAVLKLLAPNNYHQAIARGLCSFAECWLACNRQCYCWLHRPEWLHELDVPLSRDASYLLLANHRSWSDIPVLLFLLLGKAPFFRFLMKRELQWLPVIGWGAWALDFPLLYRFSKAHLQSYPQDRYKDQASLERLCQSLRQQPATIIIFVEGTRFTPSKHKAQNSPYDNLLHPRSGGVSVLLEGLGDEVRECLDFTLCYEDGTAGFWQFLCGKTQVAINLQKRPIPPSLLIKGDMKAKDNSQAVKEWLHTLWADKDKRLLNVSKHLPFKNFPSRN